MAVPFMERFQTDKENILSLCQKLENLFPEKELQQRLHSIRTNLTHEQFRLVILGQFKRGKSTFINALLGEAILPTDVIPVTAVITELMYGQRKAIQVHFTDGKTEEYPYDALIHFVSESQNPHNQKQVDKVVVFHPAPFLSEGLILVDTPGVGSIHRHNTRLTQEYIPQVDAAIFLFSADPPLTEMEQQFLKIILPVVPHVFFVLNKMDYLESSHLKKVIQFNKNILENLGVKNPQIYAISALKGLKARKDNTPSSFQESGMEIFESHLREFLVKHKGRFLLLSNAERLERILLEKKNFLEMEQQARTFSIEKLQKNLTLFQNFIKDIRRQKERLSFLLDGIRTRLMAQFDETFQSFYSQHVVQIQKEWHQFLHQQGKKSHKALMEKTEQFINDAVIDHFEPFRMRMEKELKRRYEEEIHGINQETLEIINKVYRYAAELFQLKEATVLPEEVWQFESQFYYKTWETVTTLDLLEGQFIRLLPRWIFLPILRRKTHRLILQKLERQGGRLRGDVLYRLQDSNRQYIYEFERTVEQIEQDVTQLIQKQMEMKEKGQEELATMQQEHQQKMRMLEEFLQNIATIFENWKSPTAPILQDD